MLIGVAKYTTIITIIVSLDNISKLLETPLINQLILSNVRRCWLAMPLVAGFLRWVLFAVQEREKIKV